MRVTSPPFPGHDPRNHLATAVLATLTVLGLLAMHGLGWGHDASCHGAASASSMYDASHEGLAVSGDEHASMLGMVPASTVDLQKAAESAAGTGSNTARFVRDRSLAFASPQTIVTALVARSAPGAPLPMPGSFTLLCVAILTGLAGLAVIALLLVATRRADARRASGRLTRFVSTAPRRTRPWPHLSPRLEVLCVSRT